MNKLSFLTALLLFTAAHCILDPVTVFGPNANSNNDFREKAEVLATSPISQRAAIRYLFKKADANGNGRLNLNEFTSAYRRIEKFTGDTYSTSFIQTEFEQGNIVNTNGNLNLEEFAFLCSRLFLYIHKNDYLFEPFFGQFSDDRIISTNIATRLTDINLSVSFPDLFATFDLNGNNGISFNEFKNGLAFIGGEYGFDLTFNGPNLRDYFDLLEPNSQGSLTRQNFEKFLVPLQNLLTFTYNSMPRLDNYSLQQLYELMGMEVPGEEQPEEEEQEPEEEEQDPEEEEQEPEEEEEEQEQEEEEEEQQEEEDSQEP